MGQKRTHKRNGGRDKKKIVMVKRVLDLAAAAGVLLVSLPLWPVIALAIKIESEGPVFYIQKRVGKDGRLFSLIKFRSMIKDAEEHGAVWAGEDDWRITRTGKVLRRCHLDELPQLINVIKGEMSLVGPRPERPEFVAELKKLIPDFSRRQQVKPGLTGWAQVNFPYASSSEESRKKLEYDLYYIRKRSVLFDIKILLRTIRKLFAG
jgi:lipopolysaccharide/colanic/teichoic acid biosynthesis glycosyltransferase